MKTTNSWIFLAVAVAAGEMPTRIEAIINAADFINHAVPTQEELQTSFEWLTKQGLILKEGEKIMLTENGMALYKEATAESKRMLAVWDYLNERFST